MDRARGNARVIESILDGDPGIIREFRDAIRTVVRGFHFAGDLLDELSQDILERLFVNLKAGRFRGESTVRTYALKIAKYACLERLRRTRFESSMGGTTLPETLDLDGPEESLLRRETIERSLRALRCLPQECRELFRLIFVEELSYRDVGARLGISEAAVKSRVRRCRLVNGDGSCDAETQAPSRATEEREERARARRS